MNPELLKYLIKNKGLEDDPVAAVALALAEHNHMFGKRVNGPHTFIKSQERVIISIDKVSIKTLEKEKDALGERMVGAEMENPESKAFYTFPMITTVKDWQYTIDVITDLEEYYLATSLLLGDDLELTTTDLEYIKEKIEELLP